MLLSSGSLMIGFSTPSLSILLFPAMGLMTYGGHLILMANMQVREDGVSSLTLQSAPPLPRPRPAPPHYMGAWQGVAMDSLKFHPGCLCPTLLSTVGEPPLKRSYSRFRGCLPIQWSACSLLLPRGHPTPYAYDSLCSHVCSVETKLIP
jgi:hypothetical protein